MFSRMLKLPEAVRQRPDISSLKVASHGAAPCPVQVKQDMIDWWGLIIWEYYGSTEGMGFTACDATEWLAHKGSVGRPLFGEIHILDPNLQPCPPGTIGKVWFKLASRFEYYNDEERTKQVLSNDGAMGTVGDVGYLDTDGYLYLTDRSNFMIISGDVNIYPQECEDLLITHPKIADAAVFGVPNADLGEEVKAAVQLMPDIPSGPDTEAELIAFCGRHLARYKVPRSIDFEKELPRLPTGKLYKRILRDRYWQGQVNRIV
jgi:long-chain acyl-CoA synthetase